MQQVANTAKNLIPFVVLSTDKSNSSFVGDGRIPSLMKTSGSSAVVPIEAVI